MRWVIDSADAASLSAARRQVAEYVAATCSGRVDDFMVELMVGELLGAEWYKQAGAIALEVDCIADKVYVDVWDQGPALDLESKRDPLDEPKHILLRRFKNELTIEHTEQGNHIRIALPASSPAGTSQSARIWEMAATMVGIRSGQIEQRFHKVIRDDDAVANKQP